MHPYATNSTERTDVLVWLFVPVTLATIFVLWLFGEILGKFDFSPPIWLQALVGGPSATVSLWLAYHQLESSWWKNRPLRWLLGIKLPDIEGEWKVEGRTSHEGDGLRFNPWDATVTIAQTWTEISVYLDAPESFSKSLNAVFAVKQEGGLSVLTYEYESTSRPTAPPTMLDHHGVTRLTLKPLPKGLHYLDGDYYSDPKVRGNYGTMKLKRV